MAIVHVESREESILIRCISFFNQCVLIYSFVMMLAGNLIQLDSDSMSNTEEDDYELTLMERVDAKTSFLPWIAVLFGGCYLLSRYSRVLLNVSWIRVWSAEVYSGHEVVEQQRHVLIYHINMKYSIIKFFRLNHVAPSYWKIFSPFNCAKNSNPIILLIGGNSVIPV